MKRKIAAILAADIAGYSRLVAEDEEETLRRLGTCRAVFSDFVARYGGRIFNTAGDATLAEFQSAVDAIRCAIDVQESLRTRNLAYAPSRHMSYRIGITIGDVVERDGDLLGDGVNIASRLESFAPAGGICISRSVHEAVTNKIGLKFDNLGLLQLKNIPDRVHAYTAALDKPERRRAASLTALRVIGIAAVLMIAVLGVGVYVFTRSILPLWTSSGVGHTSPQSVAVEQDKTTFSQARTDSPSASPSYAREPRSALDEADRKTSADTKLTVPARRDETRPPAATALGPTPTPALEQSSTTAPEQKEGADKEGESCRRYLPSVGKTVEVPCERAQDRAEDVEKAVEATEGGHTEAGVFVGQWATSETACKKSWDLNKDERRIIFGAGTAQYLAPNDGGSVCINVTISQSSSAMSLTALCPKSHIDCKSADCPSVSDPSGDLSLHPSGEQLVGFGPDGQALQLRRCGASTANANETRQDAIATLTPRAQPQPSTLPGNQESEPFNGVWGPSPPCNNAWGKVWISNETVQSNGNTDRFRTQLCKVKNRNVRSEIPTLTLDCGGQEVIFRLYQNEILGPFEGWNRHGYVKCEAQPDPPPR